MSNAWETLAPLLVRIQANLDGELGLDALSHHAGLSPAHLHRLFKIVVGETPKQYVARTRIERSAFRLMVQDSSLLDIALDSGYRNHETYTRAFRRRYGVSPSQYRDWARRQHSQPDANATGAMADAPQFALSSTKIARLRPMHVAFIRHIGPYESVPNMLYEQLDAWASQRRLPSQRIWLGIGHDAPGATPSHQLRFDAALVVPEAFAPEGRIGHQCIDGGDFAVTTHAGSLDTLPLAYAAIFPRLANLSGYQAVGLPALEIYHESIVGTEHALHHTDICLPVIKQP